MLSDRRFVVVYLLILPAFFLKKSFYVMSGRLAQLETKRFLGDTLQKHYENGGFLFGICNGFQILTKLGILPKASLIWNKSKRCFLKPRLLYNPDWGWGYYFFKGAYDAIK